MYRCMEQAAAAMGATVETQRQTRYYPYTLDINSPVVTRFIKACETMDLPCRLQSGGGGSDNNVLVRHGIMGMVLSCGMMQIHSCREEISICDLANMAKLVETLLDLP